MGIVVKAEVAPAGAASCPGQQLPLPGQKEHRGQAQWPDQMKGSEATAGLPV